MNDYRNYLMHHGILGQKWGVRRYQNSDGSLTSAGKVRYGHVDRHGNIKYTKKEAQRLYDDMDNDRSEEADKKFEEADKKFEEANIKYYEQYEKWVNNDGESHPDDDPQVLKMFEDAYNLSDRAYEVQQKHLIEKYGKAAYNKYSNREVEALASAAKKKMLKSAAFTSLFVLPVAALAAAEYYNESHR